MPLNAVCFGAKCSVFWCKMQGKMVQDAVQKDARCDTKSIKIRYDCINKTLSNYEKNGSKGQNSRQKVGF